MDGLRWRHPHRDVPVRNDGTAADAWTYFDAEEKLFLREAELGDDVKALIEGDLGRATENCGGGVCKIGVVGGSGGAGDCAAAEKKKGDEGVGDDVERCIDALERFDLGDADLIGTVACIGN